MSSDGKMLKDMMNIKHEMEAMVLSGAPGYIEGKLIDVIELTGQPHLHWSGQERR